jgi:spermidine synthase
MSYSPAQFSLGLRIRAQDALALPVVRETIGTRALWMGDTLQSEMDLLAPTELVLEYTRLMMGFVLFQAKARSIAMIGLGGGSLAKYCFAAVPSAVIRVAEIEPRVIALRRLFEVPDDQPRFSVIEDEGSRYVRMPPKQFDVILADAFDANGPSAPTTTQRFYDDCNRCLMPGGVLVTNLHLGRPDARLQVERMCRSFSGNVVSVPEQHGHNTAVFARKGQSLQPDAQQRSHAADLLGPVTAARLREFFG